MQTLDFLLSQDQGGIRYKINSQNDSFVGRNIRSLAQSALAYQLSRPVSYPVACGKIMMIIAGKAGHILNTKVPLKKKNSELIEI